MTDKPHDGVVRIPIETCLNICHDYIRDYNYSPEWFTGPPQGIGRYLCIVACGEGNWVENICCWTIVNADCGRVTLGWATPAAKPIEYPRVLGWWPLPASFETEADDGDD